MILAMVRLPLVLLLLMYQSILLALSQIRSNKIRSFLTMIGIVIGVASVTAVIAAMTGLKDNVVHRFESMGANKMFIYPQTPQTGRFAEGRWRDIRFKPEQFDGWKERCPDIKALSLTVQNEADISFASRSEKHVHLTGIEPDWLQIENRSVQLGRPFTYVDNEQGRPVCLVSSQVVEKLNIPRDAEGKHLLINDRRFTIIGVVEDRADQDFFGGGDGALEVFIPFKTGFTSAWMNIEVVAASVSPTVADEAQAEMKFFLRHQRHLKLDDPDTFQVYMIQKFVDQFKQTASTMTMVAGGIVGISLLVGGVGIMNIMLVSVSERTREIGLRKAVGARPSAILLQFLLEAIMLCCLGGLFGVILGEILTRMLTHIPGAELGRAEIPGWAIAISFGFAASVGLIFGMFPAIKAAQLDPIDALRHD
jgi:putative ABC transport system permease protein